MGTRHVVLTRALYGPDWKAAHNAARLELTRTVTVPLMERQTVRGWTWRILVDPRDELLAERKATFAASLARVEFVEWIPPDEPENAPWDTRPPNTRLRDRIAAHAYRAPWLGQRDVDADLLMTRIDDDDGFAPDALERFEVAARHLISRTALMLPTGFRIWGGRMDRVVHVSNAMSSLFTPAGDSLCIYDYGHTQVRHHVPVVIIDRRPAWLWIRHPYTLSGFKRARSRITPAVMKAFPGVDWRALGAHL